jgi:hypothetical protein
MPNPRPSFLSLSLAASLLAAALGRGQIPPVDAGAIKRVDGLRQDAPARVVDPVPVKEQATAAILNAQGVQKVDGLDKVEGIKPPPVKPPAPPPPPPPPHAAPVSATAVGSAATIQPVKGITGIESLKRQNLEKALQIKTGSAETPAGTGAEKGGKGKAAAAALLTGNREAEEPQPAPKEDGRAKLQDVKKLLESGS